MLEGPEVSEMMKKTTWKARRWWQQDLEGISPDVLSQAITDVFAGKTTEYSPEMANTIIEEYLKKAGEAKFSLNKEAGEHFLSDNKNKEGDSFENLLEKKYLLSFRHRNM